MTQTKKHLSSTDTEKKTETEAEPLTVKEVCDWLKVSRDTWNKWVQKRTAPPFFRLPNGQLRIPVDTFLAWIDSLAEVA